jgi:hypothetical protein
VIPDPKQAESFILRLLIHYIGDIHQPLHNVARINRNNKEGDKGGNKFNLSPVNNVTNLHYLWDSVLYEY